MSDWPQLLCDPDSVAAIAGDDESIAAVRARIDGHHVVLIWCRFGVAAGTLSIAGGRRFVGAVEFAIAHRLPVVAIANSGGARMQEGTRAFAQMIGCTAAVGDLRAAGLPLIVYLADPTTGGVFASWASLGHVTFAEPGAVIGFTGPRVAAALGEPIEPERTQIAEGLAENGLVDDLVGRDQLRAAVAAVLSVLAPSASDDLGAGGVAPAPVTDGPSGWAAVESSRDPGRPDLLEMLIGRCGGFVELRGDRAGGSDDSVLVGLGRLDRRRVLIVGHRRAVAGPSRPTVAGLRLARRAMAIAEELEIPVITVIDTPGAAIGGEQEAAGFAGEVARSIDTMLHVKVPTVAIVAGQGSGGAALAWMAADVVIAAPDAWVAPIAPEAASLILHRVSDRAAELADLQRVGAVDLLADGLVDAMYRLADLVDAAAGSIDVLAVGSDRSAALGRRRRFDRD